MERLSEDIIRKLIEINMERRHGYEFAAKFVSCPEKRKLLLNLSSQSEGFVMELTYFLKLYGGSIGSASMDYTRQEQDNFDPNQSDQATFLILLQQEIKRIAHYNHLLTEGIDLDNTLVEKIRAQKSELMESERKLTDDLKD